MQGAHRVINQYNSQGFQPMANKNPLAKLKDNFEGPPEVRVNYSDELNKFGQTADLVLSLRSSPLNQGSIVDGDRRNDTIHVPGQARLTRGDDGTITMTLPGSQFIVGSDGNIAVRREASDKAVPIGWSAYGSVAATAPGPASAAVSMACESFTLNTSENKVEDYQRYREPASNPIQAEFDDFEEFQLYSTPRRAAREP